MAACFVASSVIFCPPLASSRRDPASFGAALTPFWLRSASPDIPKNPLFSPKTAKPAFFTQISANFLARELRILLIFRPKAIYS
jgi:hypothetical protein